MSSALDDPFTRLYIEALLRDAQLADQVHDPWIVGDIGDHLAALAWFWIAMGYRY